MSTSKEVVRMYDALLSLDVLDKPVKLDLQVPCRLLLELAMAVDQGVAAPDAVNLLKMIVSKEDLAKLEEIKVEVLKRGKLEGFYQKLKELGQG